MSEARDRYRDTLVFLSGAREAGLIGFTLLLVTVVSIHSPRFLALDNFGEIALDVAILTIVAIGQMMVAITGGIDLSVGSGLALSGMLVGLMYKHGLDLNPVPCRCVERVSGLDWAASTDCWWPRARCPL